MRLNIFIIILFIGFTSTPLFANETFPLHDLTIEKLSTANQDMSKFITGKKLIFVDFWASWCEPCKMSFPYYNELYKKYKNDIQIIGISLDDDKSDSENFIKQSQPLFPTFIDTKNTSIKKLKIPAIPYLFILNDKLEIIEKIRGFDKAEKRKIDELLRLQKITAQ